MRCAQHRVRALAFVGRQGGRQRLRRARRAIVASLAGQVEHGVRRRRILDAAFAAVKIGPEREAGIAVAFSYQPMALSASRGTPMPRSWIRASISAASW